MVKELDTVSDRILVGYGIRIRPEQVRYKSEFIEESKVSEIVDIMDLDESKYKNLLDEDIIENVDRKFYSGLLCRESSGKKPNGGLIWEEQDSETKRETTSEIVYFDAPDEETAAELLEEYTSIASG